MMLLLVFASFTTWSVIPSSWGFQSSVFFGVMIGGSETSTYVRAQRATSKCEGSALAQSISLTLLHRAGCYEPSATVPADVSNYGTCTGWDGHDKGCGDEHQPAGDVKLGLGANVSIDGTGSGQVVGRDGCGQGYGNELQPDGSVENVLRANVDNLIAGFPATAANGFGDSDGYVARAKQAQANEVLRRDPPPPSRKASESKTRRL